MQPTHAIPADIQRLERRAALMAVTVGIALLVAKFIAYALTGSSAIFTDAAESIVNVLASLFAAWAIWYAQQPPDERHRYGHGNIEFVSALFEGGMILMAALVAVARAAEVLWRGPELQHLGAGVAIVAGAGIINGLVGLLLLRTGRRTGSLTLEADGRHLLTDAMTSIILLATLGVIALGGWAWLDPIAAVVLAIYLGWEGLHLVRRGFLGLMDTSDPDDDALLRRVLDGHTGPSGHEPRVCSFHALRHRHIGRDHWVEFHLVVPRDWDIARGHAAATAIEIELQEALGHSDPLTPGSARATAHVEPCSEPECTLCVS